jgi:hypothetical protein
MGQVRPVLSLPKEWGLKRNGEGGFPVQRTVSLEECLEQEYSHSGKSGVLWRLHL